MSLRSELEALSEAHWQNDRVKIKLAAEASNAKAHALYRSLGFGLLNERDGDDLVFGLNEA